VSEAEFLTWRFKPETFLVKLCESVVQTCWICSGLTLWNKARSSQDDHDVWLKVVKNHLESNNKTVSKCRNEFILCWELKFFYYCYYLSLCIYSCHYLDQYRPIDLAYEIAKSFRWNIIIPHINSHIIKKIVAIWQ